MSLLDLHRRGRVVLGLDTGDAFTAFSVVDQAGKGVLNAFIPGAGDVVSKYTNQAADWGKQKYGPHAAPQAQIKPQAARSALATMKHRKASAPVHEAAHHPAPDEVTHRDAARSVPPWVEPVAVGGALAVVIGLALTLVKRRRA